MLHFIVADVFAFLLPFDYLAVLILFNINLDVKMQQRCFERKANVVASTEK